MHLNTSFLLNTSFFTIDAILHNFFIFSAILFFATTFFDDISILHNLFILPNALRSLCHAKHTQGDPESKSLSGYNQPKPIKNGALY